MTPTKPEEAPKKRYQISELARPGMGGANTDDGQDFDPRSDAVNELGANEEDLAKNRDTAATPKTP